MRPSPDLLGQSLIAVEAVRTFLDRFDDLLGPDWLAFRRGLLALVDEVTVAADEDAAARVLEIVPSLGAGTRVEPLVREILHASQVAADEAVRPAGVSIEIGDPSAHGTRPVTIPPADPGSMSVGRLRSAVRDLQHDLMPRAAAAMADGPSTGPPSPPSPRAGSTGRPAARASATAQGTARFLNAGFFERRGGAPLAADAPLVLREPPYYLGVNIGSFWGIGAPDVPFDDSVLRELLEESSLHLDLRVRSTGAMVRPARTTLELPRTGDGPLRFIRLTFAESGRHTIALDALFRGRLLQTKELSVWVTADDSPPAPADSLPPQDARTSATPLGALTPAALEPLAERAVVPLTVLAGREPHGGLIRLTFYRSGDKVSRHDSRLTEPALAALLAGVRQQLEGAMAEYSIGVGGDLQMLTRYLGRWSEVGNSLYRALLPDSPDGRAARRVTAAIEPGQVLQVVSQSPGLTIPWDMIYDWPIESYEEGRITLCPDFLAHGSRPADCPHYLKRTVVCPHGFWGYRYIIEHFPSFLTSAHKPARRRLALDIPNDLPLRIAAIVYQGLADVDPHLAKLQRLAGDRLQMLRVDTKDGVRAALTAVAEPFDIVYFYSHGGLDGNTPALLVGSDAGKSFIKVGDLENWEVDLEEHAPLVVLNACKSAASAPDQFEDLVGCFGESGAAGVIGTQCLIQEPLADAFILHFFEHFLRRRSLGEALFAARWELLRRVQRAADGTETPAPDPRGLVYSLFAAAEVSLRTAVL